MRTIKFRGFSKELGKWVVGSLVNRPKPYIVGEMLESNEEYCNLEFWHPVDAETVGQNTGLLDKNGKEIYEGDIIRCFDSNEEHTAFNTEVWFYEGKFLTRYYAFPVSSWSSERKQSWCEVIGNIYENPELLGGKDE